MHRDRAFNRVMMILCVRSEPMHRIRKGQIDFSQLRLKDTTAPAVWSAVLAARQYW